MLKDRPNSSFIDETLQKPNKTNVQKWMRESRKKGLTVLQYCAQCSFMTMATFMKKIENGGR